MKLLSQKRAAYALGRVQAVGKEGHDYARLCRDLPAMLLQNGLGQSLAFLISKNENAHAALYADISGWLIHERRIYAGGDLIKAVMEGGRNEYMAAQEEALELSGWLKRFADATIGKEDHR
ncbi:MAG: type III-B CRISPR module-associated protein Cmr5 [Rubrobacteraceae bacterium]